ncbi:uncharacterized protein LY79DRAFT_563339 [Colletotrichum navitas]|uniref:Uncharacterized protein n=1 Tax=Colletotrichum navitas TaxID=681940 RepID=A0AAD8V189_9PEZI|nr:uncharacterized protein LY79DRAFT_563339 [Colletotrichum navitas]KAK1579756.1 hypothetical protein LY79DRAFT_563339 [Colletotrichum navitas]
MALPRRYLSLGAASWSVRACIARSANCIGGEKRLVGWDDCWWPVLPVGRVGLLLDHDVDGPNFFPPSINRDVPRKGLADIRTVAVGRWEMGTALVLARPRCCCPGVVRFKIGSV